MAKVSIIIPVYNVKQYLRECLDSVCNQTLKDIEIICVDDGSTDGSEQILDEYAQMDQRFKVIHKKNEGYGKALNIGVENANADYIGIVESDDFIDIKMYEELYKSISSEKVDFVRSDFIQFYGPDSNAYLEEYVSIVSNEEHRKWYNKPFNVRENELSMLYQKFNWNGLYRRQFIEQYNIKHNETPGASFQDNGFWFQTMMFANKFLLIDKAFYHYRIDNVSSSMFSRKKAFAVWDEYDYIDGIIDRLDREYSIFYKWSSVKRLSGSLANIGRMGASEQAELAKMMKEFYLQAIADKRLEIEDVPLHMRRQIDSLILDTEGFLDDINKKTRLYLNMFDKYENIIIYGAGKIGKSVWNKLHYERVYIKVRFFAVSSENNNLPYIENIPVKMINKLEQYKEKSLIIVAIKEPECLLVRDQLMMSKWKNIMLYYELDS